MKKTTAYLFTILLLVITIAPFTSAQQRRVVLNERFTVPSFGFDDCNQLEDFSGSGTFHILVIESPNRNGTLDLDVKLNGHFTVSGVNSGTRYVINETYRQDSVFSMATGAGGGQFSIVQRIISRGPLENDFVRITYNFAYDESGNFSITDYRVSIDCRGR